MKIAIIGSGNVATQLGKAFSKCGHEIVFVYSRNIRHAEKLGMILKSGFGNNLKDVSEYPAEVFIIAVRDDAICEVVKKMSSLKDKLVLHTSGATDISILKKKFKNCGVLWQIQTIREREQSDFKKVPVVIEASNAASEKKLTQLANNLSDNVQILNSMQRRVLHLGAVWVNNFPNHLYYIAEKLLKRHRLPLTLFHPLVLSTIQSAMQNPKAAQTGPAKRNDKATMREHLKLLSDRNSKLIYKLLSKSITGTYNNS